MSLAISLKRGWACPVVHGAPKQRREGCMHRKLPEIKESSIELQEPNWEAPEKSEDRKLQGQQLMLSNDIHSATKSKSPQTHQRTYV